MFGISSERRTRWDDVFFKKKNSMIFYLVRRISKLLTMALFHKVKLSTQGYSRAKISLVLDAYAPFIVVSLWRDLQSGRFAYWHLCCLLIKRTRIRFRLCRVRICSPIMSVFLYVINTFKYHVFAPMHRDGKISVRINLRVPLFSTVLPSNSYCFCPVGLLLL